MGDVAGAMIWTIIPITQNGIPCPFKSGGWLDRMEWMSFFFFKFCNRNTVFLWTTFMHLIVTACITWVHSGTILVYLVHRPSLSKFKACLCQNRFYRILLLPKFLAINPTPVEFICTALRLVQRSSVTHSSVPGTVNLVQRPCHIHVQGLSVRGWRWPITATRALPLSPYK